MNETCNNEWSCACVHHVKAGIKQLVGHKRKSVTSCACWVLFVCVCVCVKPPIHSHPRAGDVCPAVTFGTCAAVTGHTRSADISCQSFVPFFFVWKSVLCSLLALLPDACRHHRASKTFGSSSPPVLLPRLGRPIHEPWTIQLGHWAFIPRHNVWLPLEFFCATGPQLFW
jgi:hypothetical protein